MIATILQPIDSISCLKFQNFINGFQEVFADFIENVYILHSFYQVRAYLRVDNFNCFVIFSIDLTKTIIRLFIVVIYIVVVTETHF